MRAYFTERCSAVDAFADAVVLRRRRSAVCPSGRISISCLAERQRFAAFATIALRFVAVRVAC